MYYKGNLIIKIDERFYIELEDCFIECFTLKAAKEYIDKNLSAY